MVYVTAGFGVLLLLLSLGAKAGARREDRAAQRRWYLAASVAGVCTAAFAVVSLLVA